MSWLKLICQDNEREFASYINYLLFYHVMKENLLLTSITFCFMTLLQVRLYDHRLLQRGAVQCYEGHFNSHTHIQLGVDPSERFVMSGMRYFSDAIYFTS